MHRVNYKPLSMNEAFMGRKRKTAKYRDYEIKVPKELPDLDLPSRGPLGSGCGWSLEPSGGS